MSQTNTRIQWINGLKGILVVWIIIFHYSIAFINKGYIGFSTNYAEADQFDAYIQNLPFSLFINSSFPLYVFLFLIAYIPAYQFFSTGSEERIIRQAKIRYFRIMPPTFMAFVINFILHHAGLLRHAETGESLGVMWLKGIMGVDFSIPSLLYEGLVKTYVSGSQYISVSWVMGYIFIGSYISYAVILLFCKSSKRFPLYAGVFAFLFFFDQMYICFLMGIVAADIVRLTETGKLRTLPSFVSVILIILGLLTSIFPSVYLPKWLDAVVLQAMGALLLVAGMAGCKKVQSFLEFKLFRILGDYSFSAILIHMPVMSAVSCLQYLIMTEKGIPSSTVILSVFLAAVPVQILAAFLFQKITVPLTSAIGKAIDGKRA